MHDSLCWKSPPASLTAALALSARGASAWISSRCSERGGISLRDTSHITCGPRVSRLNGSRRQSPRLPWGPANVSLHTRVYLSTLHTCSYDIYGHVQIVYLKEGALPVLIPGVQKSSGPGRCASSLFSHLACTCLRLGSGGARGRSSSLCTP